MTQQAMETVDHSTALPGELVAAVGEEPQHGSVVLGADAAQIRLALGHSGDAGSVDGISLAPMAAIEQPGTGSQRRRHVEHGLLGYGQLLGEEVSETAGALHGPDPFGPPLRPVEQSLCGRSRR
jgi:hypothetical protein